MCGRKEGQEASRAHAQQTRVHIGVKLSLGRREERVVLSVSMEAVGKQCGHLRRNQDKTLATTISCSVTTWRGEQPWPVVAPMALEEADGSQEVPDVKSSRVDGCTYDYTAS